MVQGTVGKGLVRFDQSAVDEDTGSYNYTGNNDADVVASAGGTLTADSIRVTAHYDDDIFVDSTAAGGGAISLSGAVTVLENYLVTSAEVADGAVVLSTVRLTSDSNQVNDFNADSYSIALASGAGAMATDNASSANIAVGSGSVKAKRITLNANNDLTKDRYQTSGYSLRSGSAAIGNVAILVNRADLGNGARISVADGASMVSNGTYNDPGVIQFNASTDLEVYNKTLTESVSGFGVSVAVTETDVDASNTVVISRRRSTRALVMLKFSLTMKR